MIHPSVKHSSTDPTQTLHRLYRPYTDPTQTLQTLHRPYTDYTDPTQTTQTLHRPYTDYVTQLPYETESYSLLCLR